MGDRANDSSSLAPERRVAAAAAAILRGQLGIIEGARLLLSLRSRLSSFDHDPAFIAFVAIDSETDHLPVGEVRQHWAADALAQMDEEIRAAEDYNRAAAYCACQRLLELFSSKPNEPIGNDREDPLAK